MYLDQPFVDVRHIFVSFSHQRPTASIEFFFGLLKISSVGPEESVSIGDNGRACKRIERKMEENGHLSFSTIGASEFRKELATFVSIGHVFILQGETRDEERGGEGRESDRLDGDQSLERDKHR